MSSVRHIHLYIQPPSSSSMEGKNRRGDKDEMTPAQKQYVANLGLNPETVHSIAWDIVEAQTIKANAKKVRVNSLGFRVRP